MIGAYDHDDDLVARVRHTARPDVRVYPYPGRAVVLGRGSDPETELHLDACQRDGVPILRRRGGGCAVYLDPGNLIISVALPLPGFGRIRWAREQLTEWLMTSLSRWGIGGIAREGISDLVIADRKVAGSCIHRTRDLILYGSTLLIDPDLEHVERYLKHPPREPDYRRGRSHRDFMGRIGVPDRTLDAASLRGRLLPLPDPRHPGD